MILIVDLNKYYFELVSKNQVPSRNKIIKLLYDDLYLIEEQLLLAITVIVISNTLFSEYHIEHSNLSQFLSKKTLKVDKQSHLINLLLNSEILTPFSFSLFDSNQSKLNTGLFSNGFFQQIGSIIPRLNNFEFIFFDNLITGFLSFFLILPQNLQGYKVSNIKNKTVCSRIANPKKYIWTSYLLAVLEETNSLYTSFTKTRLNNLLLSQLEYSQKKDNPKSFIVIIDKSEMSIQDSLINLLESKYEDIQKLNFDYDESFPDKFDRLLVFNIENLDVPNIRKILGQLNSPSSKYKLCVIFSTRALDLTEYPNIIELMNPPQNIFEKIVGYCRNLLDTNRAILHQVYNQILNLQKSIVGNKAEFNRIKRRLEDLITPNIIHNKEKIEFWYNIEFFNPIQFEIPKETIDELQEYFTTPPPQTFKMIHENFKDVWMIEIDGVEICKLSYKRAKAIKYIAYLGKYYSNSKISASTLREVVDKWHNSKEKEKTDQTDAAKISKDLSYFYSKQCPELRPLQQCIKISELETNCFYAPVKNIVLEIIDNDIPPMR